MMPWGGVKHSRLPPVLSQNCHSLLSQPPLVFLDWGFGQEVVRPQVLPRLQAHIPCLMQASFVLQRHRAARFNSGVVGPRLGARGARKLSVGLLGLLECSRLRVFSHICYMSRPRPVRPHRQFQIRKWSYSFHIRFHAEQELRGGTGR